MYKIHIILAIIYSFSIVNSENICDKCLCQTNSENKKENANGNDVIGEIIDCSHNADDVLKSNYTTPNWIKCLDLSSTQLIKVERNTLFRSRTMSQLFLNKNMIVDIENDALCLPELKYLDLSFNQLESVNEEIFKDMIKLEYLNLANNKFTVFSKSNFHYLSNLNELILDNNNIGPKLREINLFDRNGFGLTHRIKTLSISGVNLNTVSDNFFIDAYEIKKLIVSNNNFSETFQIPYTLEYFDISDNPIGQISIEDFLDLPGLKELKLNNLLISEIDDYVFSPLHSLTKLEVERNHNLTRFSPLAFGSEVLDDPLELSLQELSIKNSRLTTLDKQLLEPFGELIRLDLQGNPWHCDCKLVWLKKLQIQERDYEHLRCATPPQFYNAKIFDLQGKYFKCPIQVRRNYVGLILAGVALCVILATVALWMFCFLPKYQSRCRTIQNLYGTSTMYSILPVNIGESDGL